MATDAAAIPTAHAITAPVLQWEAIHEGIRARELIMRMIWTDCHRQGTEYPARPALQRISVIPF